MHKRVNKVFIWTGFFAFVVIQAAAGFWTWWWLETGQYHFYPKNFGVVDEGQIFRSARLNEQTLMTTYKEHEIDAIIDLTNHEADDPEQRAEMVVVKQLDLEFYRFNGLDGSGITKSLDDAAAIALYIEILTKVVQLKQDGKRFIVHCAAGAERTGGTFAIYRLLFQGHDPQDIVQEMRRFRHDPEDNPELIPFLNRNMHAIAQGLYERGVLKELPEVLPKLPEG